MSIPLPGTYRIRSVKFPNQLFDLQGGNVKARTPVIGYANNSDSKNMLVSVDFLSQKSQAQDQRRDRASGQRG
jgi:hypothetical protein